MIHGIMWRGRVSPQASQQSSAQAVWVVPALRQLHEITRSFIKQTYQKQDKVRVTSTSSDITDKDTSSRHLFFPVRSSRQSIIQDLKKNFEIVKLITGSLVCCHRLAVTAGGSNNLSGSTVVDGRYTYQEVSTMTETPREPCVLFFFSIIILFLDVIAMWHLDVYTIFQLLVFYLILQPPVKEWSLSFPVDPKCWNLNETFNCIDS